ncbi:hypothetical protein BCV70DRAFT_156846 [Testicularia cyperi]|uniref:Phosphoglycerate mutase-like protein n=1 Tax=Testicularia cyperi TaxID=1882483 RepID=A0A317XY61_9BASI|nr:hypothetical protein BCV70DRAFT_156846 [Testicularia cyperi]
MPLNHLLVTLVRHGESQDNQHGIWAGFRDTPLTPNGVSQARALGQAFANVSLTAIYSSDLRRASMTAEEILKANRSIPPPPLVQSKSLREQNFGQAEGQSYASAEWAQGSSGQDARVFRFPDGESLEEVNARIAKAVRQFVLPRVESLRRSAASPVPPAASVTPSSGSNSNAPVEGGHICIVAHGIAIAELLRVFMSLHHNSPSSPWADPKATYKRIRLENTGWSRLELAVPSLNSDLSPESNGSAPSDALAWAGSGVELLSAQSASAAVSDQTQPRAYTDFGEIQADIVEGGAESDRYGTGSVAAVAHTETNPQTAQRPTQHESRPIYVRLLCQNQTDHLRGFSLPTGAIPTGSSAAASNLLGGGGSVALIGANSATSPNPASSSPRTTTSTTGTGLPASSTLASIASNATTSNSHTGIGIAIPLLPTTPANAVASAAASSASRPGLASAPSSAAPASARSLLSYDVKMMTRELERAGATGMLTGLDGSASGTATASSATLSNVAGAQERLTTSTGLSSSSSTNNVTTGLLERSVFPTSPTTTSSHPSSYSGGTGNTGGGSSSSVVGGGSGALSGGGFPFSTPGASSDVWQAICVRVLPLFNGEPLRSSIEELNESVTAHVRRTVERSPARAIESLTSDLISLTSSGTLTLNSKLQGLDDTRLLVRMVEVWTFYLTQVLPYVEGCFLPLRTDLVLQSLTSSGSARQTSAAASSAVDADGGGGGAVRVTGASIAASTPSQSSSTGYDKQRIDVRRILLSVFRDQVILPIYERLFHLFAHIVDLDPAFAMMQDAHGVDEGAKQVYLRLLQMTSILASILSNDEAQGAVDSLLRSLRVGSKTASLGRTRNGAIDGIGMRPVSPAQRNNNRRGWMAQKARKHGVHSSLDSNQALVSGGGMLTTSGPEVLGSLSAARTLTGRHVPGAGFRTTALTGRYGYNVSEDEYLTSLRSPAGSPALSTPGNTDMSTPPARQGHWDAAASMLVDFIQPDVQQIDDRHAAMPSDGITDQSSVNNEIKEARSTFSDNVVRVELGNDTLKDCSERPGDGFRPQGERLDDLAATLASLA